ncbi:DNA replication complex GINS protein SLD5 [Sitodiplosis mosellana]|uniref:DNA replication complex GINS protein SLD5 n=1 Tax=Sitodiplosis mosellana TaxID=263140 RepID=UPI0024441EE5|nr:DNA replication complex GINS protein SLD5 [Sitodiplosis mosellana]
MSEDIIEDDYQLSDEEEEPITAQKVLEILQNTWLNEKFAPELLPHQSDILDLMLGQIEHMEENISQLDKNDFRYIAHRIELERIKYIVTSYLRCRIRKIETFTRALLEEDNQRPADKRRLSDDERKYAEAHMALIKRHFQQIAIQHMPANLQEESAREVVTPNLMSHIFLRANESVPSVVVGMNDEEVDLEAGSLHIMPYKLASDLLLDGKVQLI